jgi:hypothetical protein
MNLDLDDDERGALIETLLDTIERGPLSLGVKRLRAILFRLITPRYAARPDRKPVVNQI